MANSEEMMADLVEKMIAIQTNNVEIMTKTSGHIKENTRILLQISDLLKHVDGHFQNGFRADLKKFITEAFLKAKREFDEEKKLDRELKEAMCNNLRELNETLKSPLFWVKIIGSTIAAVSAVFVILSKTT